MHSMPPYYYDDPAHEDPRPPRYAEHPPPPRTRRPPPPDPYYVDQRYETYGDVDPESYGPPPRTARPAQQLPSYPPPPSEDAEARTQFVAGPGAPQPTQMPKKLTVTRVAAMRGKQLTSQAYGAFRKAATADGAEKSGLTSLYYATMLNYASDAAMAVALANTLFFSAATGESKGKVALYLLITVAPFAFVAPIIGPALDRVQRGRRFAMCATSAGQALMCVVMAANFDTWLLYPAALGKMVLSKSFTVLKAAITPRVLPPDITLAKTNARLTVFGLGAGAAAGVVAAGLTKLFDSPGALWFTAVICVVGAVQGLRIPSWVEVTEGEVPATLSEHPDKPRRQPMGRHIVVALWGNGTVRMLTGFLMLFAAFAVKAQTEGEPFQQLLQLGLIGGAAGLGSFVGNAVGARIHVGKPDQVVIGCVAGSLIATVIATLLSGIGTAAIVGLVGAIGSALAKISLDAVIQDHLPEESRASAFGRSETVLQIGWVFGGAVGVLLPPTYWVGFLVISVLLAIGLLQTYVSTRGGTLIRGFGGDRPVNPNATGTFRVPKA
nr:MFS transporter [Labedaea rhizosphaerae]